MKVTTPHCELRSANWTNGICLPSIGIVCFPRKWRQCIIQTSGQGALQTCSWRRIQNRRSHQEKTSKWHSQHDIDIRRGWISQCKGMAVKRFQQQWTSLLPYYTKECSGNGWHTTCKVLLASQCKVCLWTLRLMTNTLNWLSWLRH